MALDRVLAEIKKRFQAMQKIYTCFKMMMPKHLLAATDKEISLSVDNLCVVYKDDFDRADMNAELSQLKTWLPRILEDDPDEAGPLDVFKCHNELWHGFSIC